MIKAVLADDTDFMRSAISRLLKDCSDVELVAEADSFHGLIQVVAQHRPHVVILDLHMPDQDEVSADEIKSHLNGCPLVAISIWNDEESKARADALGAWLLLDKRLLAAELIPAIQRCANYR